MEPFELTKLRLAARSRKATRHSAKTEYNSGIDSTFMSELNGHVFHPNRFLWSLITIGALLITYSVFAHELYKSDGFLQSIVPILFPVLAVWSISKLLPYCHCLQLDPHGIYQTSFFRTGYHSWQQISEIDVLYSTQSYSRYIQYKLTAGQGAGLTVQIHGHYNIGKDQLATLMGSYLYQAKKQKLDWFNPNPKRFPSLVSPKQWGRKAQKDGTKLPKIGIWERIRAKYFLND